MKLLNNSLPLVPDREELCATVDRKITEAHLASTAETNNPSANVNDAVYTGSFLPMFPDLTAMYFTAKQHQLYTDPSWRKCIIDGVAGGGKSMLFHFKIVELGHGPGSEPILLFAQKVRVSN